MAKATSIKEAVARFEKESGFVAADSEKVRIGHCSERSSGTWLSCITLILIRRWTFLLRHHP